MESIYLILIVILFALAISDIVVGVSNDAVNFLNSAIGSKVASFKVIMAIAAVGIFVGATYSTGMMEVARKGIFHPELFNFQEIMFLFLAVMITNIILLDVFNSFGMPTSTTVSIVFGLLGSAVAIAWYRIHTDASANPELMNYINSAKALQIISGILLSVIVAFTVGAIVQWFSRLLFSFNYAKRFKYFGSIWGGIAITSITYFILIKGLKGSPYASHIMEDGTQLMDWAQSHSFQIIGVSLIIWTIILQIMQWLKLSILKFIVLIGTFALALAFAGNDLVNFIGVPLAGYNAYEYWIHSGTAADQFMMSQLSGKVPTELYILVIASITMILTLYFSKKSRAVVKTSLDLSRQDEGDERFGSSIMARNIVRGSRKTAMAVDNILPSKMKLLINRQFDLQEYKKSISNDENPPAFDMIRASVNLVVASILIAIGTSLKLPLSTTYVTFMVAMGTSLSDKAWNRESAVFRITGVISVIGGWFFTAFSAFLSAFIVAILFSYGSFYMIFIMTAIATYSLIKSNFFNKKFDESSDEECIEDIADDNILIRSTNNVVKTLSNINNVFDNLIEGLENEDRALLKNVKAEVKEMTKRSKYLKDTVYKTIKKLNKDSISTSHFYVQVLDYLRESTHCMEYMAKPTFAHVDNDFSRLLDVQFKELKLISKKLRDFYQLIFEVIETKDYAKVQAIIDIREKLIKEIESYRKKQIKRLKRGKVGSKNSMLYLGLLHETKNLLLHSVNLIKAQRDFDDYKIG